MKQILKIVFFKNKLLFLLTIIFSFIISLFNIISALILKNFIDVAIETDKSGLNSILLKSAFYIVGFLIISYITSVLRSKYVSKAYKNLSVYFTSLLLSKRISFLNGSNSSKYSAFLTSDLEKVKLDFVDNIVVLFQNICTLLLSLSIMLYFDVYLFLGILITSILTSFMGGIFQQILPKIDNQVTNQKNTVSQLFNDVIGGFHTIKLFRTENRIEEICKKKVYELEELNFKRERLLHLSKNFAMASTNIMVFVLFYIGANQAMRGVISFGTIVAYIQLLNFVVVPIQDLPQCFMKFQSVFNILKNVSELINTSRKNTLIDNDIKFSEDIVFDNVSFTYSDSKNYALKNISFKFENGKKYIIVGQSGSGKSTLLSLLQKFWTDYTGQIKIGNVDIKNIEEDAIYKNVSVVQQEVFIFDDTILNNLTMFSVFENRFLNRVIEQSQLGKLIREKGLEYNCGENGRNLSGGERQRIAIGRCLLQRTPIIIFDEATASLDNRTTKQIEEVLSEMEGITQIITSHRLNKEVLQKYDSILVMKNGVLIESGNFNELIENKGEFWALYKTKN